MSNLVPNEQAQAGLITYLKSITALVTALGPVVNNQGGANEIKEYFYQGNDFVYPGVRLQMGIQRAEGEPNCGKWLLPFYILCFSEQKSSKECSQLASIVGKIHGKKPGSLNGVIFSQIYVDQMAPPIRQDELTWRSEVICHSIVTVP
jgi:hypothetical protein